MPLPIKRHQPFALGRLQEFLKQITYGGNDGIVTTFAIVAGFAGAAADGVAQIGAVAVLVFGLANLFADAVSMGLGEFLSTRAAHDLYRARRAGAQRAIAENPQRERAALCAILRERGLPEPDVDAAAEIIARNPGMMADLIMTYDHRMMHPAGDSPALDGLFTFLSFVAFGTVPLLPYFFLPPEPATFRLSLAATGAALTALGLLRWAATDERLARSLGETVSIGALCAAVAYLVGWLVGG